MRQCALNTGYFLHKNLCFRSKTSIGEALPYILYGLLGRVKHILFVEAIIPQLVHKELIGREVEEVVLLLWGACSQELMDRTEKQRLTKLVLHGAILEVPYRGNGKEYFHIGLFFSYQGQNVLQRSLYLSQREQFFPENLLGLLMTVGHDIARIQMLIYPSRSQGYHYKGRLGKRLL